MAEHLTEHHIRAVAPAAAAGTDIRHVLSRFSQELPAPHLSALPLMPARGLHATALARSAACLSELYSELTSYGWRIVPRPGADFLRAHALLIDDVDSLADVHGDAQEQGRPAAPVHVEVLGPLSLAAHLHLPHGEKVLIDHGARRDITDSLASGLTTHVQHLLRSVNPTALHVTLSEPDYAVVRSGEVSTVSGYRTIRSVSRDDSRQLIGTVIQALRDAGAHAVYLDTGSPVKRDVLEDFRSTAGPQADGFVLPVSTARWPDWELTAEAVEAGTRFIASLGGHRQFRPAAAAPGQSREPHQRREVSDLISSLTTPWQRLGMPAAQLRSFQLAGFSDAELGSPTAAPWLENSELRGNSALLRLVSDLRSTAEALSEKAAEGF